MGARIEILSHPLTIYSQIVAPLVGARIEICNIDRCNMQILVAPLVGARIEITALLAVVFRLLCRSPRGSED